MRANRGIRSPSRYVGVIAFGLAAGQASVAAQAKVEFTPFAGVYVPTTDALVVKDVLVSGDQFAGKHKTAILFGGRLGVSLSERIGLEGAFGYTPSKGEVTYTDPSGQSAGSDTSANVILASARLLVGFGRAGGNTSWHLILGGGIIAHGGDAYDQINVTEGKTDIGGIVGLGGRFRVGPSVAIRLDVEDNLYSAKFKDASGFESDSKFQNDIVASLGVVIQFGGSRAALRTPH